MGGMIGALVGSQETNNGLHQADVAQSQANQLIQNLSNAPDAARPLILQQYRQAGILTPEMEAAISAGPSAMDKVTTNGKGVQAQEDALKQMQDRAKTGMTATDRAALAKAQSDANVEGNAKQQQIMQAFQQRGQGGQGAQLAAQLAEQQGGANRASQNALDIMGKSQQQALQAAASAGGLGSQLESQQFGEQSAKAQAADQMNRFNVQNQMAAQQANVGAKNQAQGSNLANLQNIGNQNVNMANQEQARERAGEQQNFGNQVGLANTKAGQLQNYGNFQANAGAARGKAAAETGGAFDKGLMSVIGMADGGSVPQNFKGGGHVPGHAQFEGDHPGNDTVEAVLSPGEIVVPRSIAQTSLGDKLLDLLKHHHEIKTHLDGIEKKANKPKKQKMADGGMAQPPMSINNPENAMQFGSVYDRLKQDHPGMPDEELFRAAHAVQDKIYQMKNPPAQPAPAPEEPQLPLGEKIGNQLSKFRDMQAGMADGGEVMSAADRAAGLNMFAPGALDKKPLAQYDDRQISQLNTDSATGDKSPDSSGGLADMLAKFKALAGAQGQGAPAAPEAAPMQMPQSNPQQAGLSMIAGNKPASVPGMPAPQANFAMPQMSNGGKVPQKGTPDYLQHLMDQLHGKKNYAQGTGIEDDGVVPETPDNLDEQNLEDYPDPVIDPALAQGPSHQPDMAIPEMSKEQMELPKEDEKAPKSPKEKIKASDEEIDKIVDTESKDKKDDEDQVAEEDVSDDEEPSEEVAAKEEAPSEKESTPSSNEELKELQKRRRMMLGLSGLAQSGAMLGGALNHYDSSKNVKAFQDSEKNYDLPISDFKELIANQANDPNSAVSKTVQQYMNSKGFNVPAGASAADLYKVAPFLQKDSALEASIKKLLIAQAGKKEIAAQTDKTKKEEGEKNRQSGEKRAKMMADARKEGYGKTDARQDQRLAGEVVKRIHSDPVIKPSEQNMASLAKSKTILENKKVPLTPQLLSDAEQDIASALTIRGMGGTEGKIKRSELVTLNRKIAEAKQKWLNMPSIDLRKEDPALVKQIQMTNKALMDDYEATIKDRKNDIAKEFKPMAENSPRIQKTIDQYLKAETPAAHQPGDIVMVKGKQYRVGADGDSLEAM